MSPPPPQINDHAELGNVTLFGLHMLPRRDHNGVDWALNPVWQSLQEEENLGRETRTQEVDTM